MTTAVARVRPWRGWLLGIALMGSTGAFAAEPPLPATDPHSYANPQQWRVTNVALDLAVDFPHKRLSGAVELKLEQVDPGSQALQLDTRDLQIRQVQASIDGLRWQTAPFTLSARDPVLGSRLAITLPPHAAQVRIRYATEPKASALQWLTPEQTSGKKWPFLFTQSESIYARSWIPLQDTPLVRAPYQARIRAPARLRAVMSAEMQDRPDANGVWQFSMPQPIPSYLIALAVGDIAFKSTGPRTGVYAEPGQLDRAAYEFAETEKTMQLEEQLYGPYRWGRYDLLVLPPSFPFGGMENPRLTFATPTVMTGDRKLVSLVTHELSHSWSGNLVTNAVWNDFWLNEGFTTYLTNRLNEAQNGAEFADMERVQGLRDLNEAVAQADPADRSLVRTSPSADPDAVFSAIPYERGNLFLVWLENRFGRPAFDEFLKGWFNDHAFKSATTDQFVAYLQEHLMSRQPGRITMEQVQLWLHSPQLPEFAVLPSSAAFGRVDAVRTQWLSGALATNDLPVTQWASQQWQYFLQAMPATVTLAQLLELDAQYALSTTSNRIIGSAWLTLAISRGDHSVWPASEQYLRVVGRMLLIVPIYSELAKTPDGRRFAIRVFEKVRGGYHPIAQDAIERALTKTTAS